MGQAGESGSGGVEMFDIGRLGPVSSGELDLALWSSAGKGWLPEISALLGIGRLGPAEIGEACVEAALKGSLEALSALAPMAGPAKAAKAFDRALSARKSRSAASRSLGVLKFGGWAPRGSAGDFFRGSFSRRGIDLRSPFK